jgi:hypothetical protein
MNKTNASRFERMGTMIEQKGDTMTREELIEAYNAGRRDFSGVDLSHADLRDVTLSDVTLGGAKLNKAKLIGTRLSGVDLSFADLSFADLSFADLSFADLNYADLIGAQLIGAQLIGANLRDANLRGAQLIGAILGGADLGCADLSDANLSGADLSGVALRGAILSGAIGFRYEDAPDPLALRKLVADQIEAHPELHDQGDWGEGIAGECGTPCCVAGWACRLGGGCRNDAVSIAALRLLWIDGLLMPSFRQTATREDILKALRATL